MNLYKENLKQSWSEVDPFTLERYKQFCTYLSNGQSVLDIGCNTGRGGVVLKSTFSDLKLYGIDLIQERADKIPLGIYENVFVDSIVTANCEGLKFDRIIAGEVIEHIPKEIFVDMLLNCKRLLKDDGLILFTTPNPNSLLVKLGRDSVFQDASHVNIMSIKDFRAIVVKAGLKVQFIEGSGKASRFLGYSFPLTSLYGSYLAVIIK